MARWHARAEVYPPAVSWGMAARTWFKYLRTQESRGGWQVLNYFVNNVGVTDWQFPELLSKLDPAGVTRVHVYSSLNPHLTLFSLALRCPLWPFDEISDDRRTHTPTLEHPASKSLSNMALLKYYGCLLFCKCLQMSPASASFQVPGRSQKHCLFSLSIADRKNIWAVNLASTSCQWRMSCTFELFLCVYVRESRLPAHSNPTV